MTRTMLSSLSVISLAALAAVGNAQTPSHFLFVFGDSYTAIGFNASNQPQPSIGNQFGNAPYPGARLSGGDDWIDIVVNNYSSTKTVAYDYAVGGNTINSTRVQSNNPPATPVGDLRDQVKQFDITNANKSVGWTSSNSLFITWFGINDVGTQVLQGRNLSTAEPILYSDVQDYFGLLDQLYQRGARNYLIFLVPPIYRAPVYGYGDPQNSCQNTTNYFNDRVKAEYSKWTQRHSGKITSRIVDPAPTFNQILDNPHDYGAPNSTCLNYPEGQPCLWHDFIHPGIVIQREFGKYVGQITKGLGY